MKLPEIESGRGYGKERDEMRRKKEGKESGREARINGAGNGSPVGKQDDTLKMIRIIVTGIKTKTTTTTTKRKKQLH